MQQSVLAIGTMDTKAEELRFLADRIQGNGVNVRTVDVGTLKPPPAEIRADVSSRTLLDGVQDSDELLSDRGQAIERMAGALEVWLLNEVASGSVAGVVGIGGSGGTALISHAMRAMPIGIPKLMVSTMASGNVAPYVGCSDIAMMYSVVDIAGLNSVSKVILSNAANAICGMVSSPPDAIPSDLEVAGKRTLGLTMFGVTTPCVTAVREQLESQNECLVFHATGTGGRAMEKLVGSDMIQAVLDVTTTEVADEIVGGIMPAGADRFETQIAKNIPMLLSFGAVDMVNFGARDSVPACFEDRKFHVHNPQVTLMRTTPEENRKIGVWIAEKLNRATAPWSVIFPEGGVSALDAPGQPFHDPEADQVLLSTLEKELRLDEKHQLIRKEEHINDPAFARAIVEEFNGLGS